MIAVSDLPEDEWHLARLVCGKLARLLGGMLSVGLGSLQLDSPESFLAGRDRLIRAMVEVLRHTGVKPGSESACDLHDRTTHVAQLVDDFFRHLFTLAHWRSMKKEEIQRTCGGLSSAYASLLTTLQELLQALHSPADYRPQQHKGQELIDGAVADLCTRL
jgi:hypothetical protein